MIKREIRKLELTIIYIDQLIQYDFQILKWKLFVGAGTVSLTWAYILGSLMETIGKMFDHHIKGCLS